MSRCRRLFLFFLIAVCTSAATESLHAVPPANDECASAVAVQIGDSIAASTLEATLDAGVPTCLDDGGSMVPVETGGVWYQLVGTGEDVSLSTCEGTTYDTRLTVVCADCASQTCVAADEDGCTGGSELSFATQRGATYLILVHGVPGSLPVGDFTLDVAYGIAVDPPVSCCVDADGDGVCASVDCDDGDGACSLDCSDPDGDGLCGDADCDNILAACGTGPGCNDADRDGVRGCEGDCDDTIETCAADCSDGDSSGVPDCADNVTNRLYVVSDGDYPTGQILRGSTNAITLEQAIAGPSDPGTVIVDRANGKVYWSLGTGDAIRRANLDGSQVEDVVTTGDPLHLDIDAVNGKLYWTDVQGGAILRSDLDGTGVETVLDGLTLPQGVAVDVGTGRIYFIAVFENLDRYWVASVSADGEDLVSIWQWTYSTFIDFGPIKVDPTAGKVYWLQNEVAIYGADLDGANPGFVDGFASGTWRFTVDPADGSFFLSQMPSQDPNQILHYIPPGVQEALFPGVNVLFGLDVVKDCIDADLDGFCVANDCDDTDAACSEDCSDADSDGLCADADCDSTLPACSTGVGCYDLDGDGVRVCAGDCDDSLSTCALDCTDTDGNGTPDCDEASGARIYTASTEEASILQLSPGGSTLVPVLTSIDTPEHLAVHPGADKIYWVDRDLDRIRRANLDGTGVEDVATTPMPDPRYLDIDALHDKLYWTNLDGAVHRANLDGSQSEVIVPGLDNPTGIAVDASRGFVYYGRRNIGRGRPEILRARLDGTNIESLFLPVSQSPSRVRDLAFDPFAEIVYWTQSDDNSSEVLRVAADGSPLSSLPAGVSQVEGLALDLVGGFVYFTASEAGQSSVYRMGLDGSNVTVLASTLAVDSLFGIDILRGCVDEDADGVCIDADCDDTRPHCTTDCTDADGDDFCAPQDCDDANPNCLADCTDLDGDGFCPPVDCDDGLAACQAGPECADADGDGLKVCQGDCNDQFASCTVDCTDGDGDGVPACADCDDVNPGCTIDCTDADGDGFCPPVDCNDTLAACQAGPECADMDADGLRVCEGDCDDTTPTCRLDCSDVDGDGTPDCASADRLYVATDGDIVAYTLDGVQTAVVVPGIGQAFKDVAVDRIGGKVYWTRNQVLRADLTGGSVETVVPTFAVWIAIDPVRRKIYWSNGVDGEIRRADLDGSGEEIIIPHAGVTAVRGLAVDPVRQLLYFGVDIGATAEIRRSGLDGTGVEVVALANVSHLFDVEIDPATETIYYAGGGATQKSIFAVDVDGTGTTMLTPIGDTRLLAVRSESGRIFYTDRTPESVFRIDTDGSNLVQLVSATNPWGIDILETCSDADWDGVCAFQDCDDTSPSCSFDCSDADGDGVCADVDCDPANASCVARPDCEDLDGDAVRVCDGDCDDANPACTSDCTDADGDTFCATSDCDDSRPDCFGSSCFDADGDGLPQCNDCDDSVAACTLDCSDADGDGFRACDADCDDANPDCTVDCSDADGDGVRACDGDCDDGNPLCALDCVDGDGDGLTLCDGDCDNANPNCGLDCTDLDGDGFCPPFDCDDSNPECGLDCTDSDADGFCVTRDCDDADPECSMSCADTDGDGFCADIDCSDMLASVFPGAPVDCADGQDSDCDGIPDAQEAPCAALDASNLRFTDGTTLEWDAATTAEHALYRGTIPAEGFRAWDHSCEATRLAGTLAVDGDEPPPGEGFYYMATGLDISGSGPATSYNVFLGSVSAGASRPESTLVSCGPRVFVDPDLLLADGDGLSWPTAYSTISVALVDGTAVDRGLELWVRGSPARAVILGNPRPGFRILGGFAGTEMVSWQRDPEATPTTWEPDGTSELLVADGTSVVLDGLTFRNVTTGVDVRLDGGVIAFEDVTVESISGFAVDLTARAGGTLIVRDSTFDGSGLGAVRGVVEGETLGGVLRGNTFAGGSDAAVRLVATAERADAVVDVDIVTNRFTGGASALILSADVSNQPHDALVSSFVASNWIGGTSGDAVIVEASGDLPSSTIAQSVVASPLIVHNTISDAGSAGLAVSASRTDPSPDPTIHPVQAIPQVWNNLLTFHGGPAIAESSDDPVMGVVADPVVVGNDLFGSGGLYLDEGSLSLLTVGEVNALAEARDNLDADPSYVDRVAGDYHIANGTVVGLGSTVRYVANQSDPGIGTGWTQPLFDDSTWSMGFYGVGYDTGPAPNALAYLFTQVPVGSSSVYTRTTFTVDDPLAVQQLVLGVDWDDGYAAWLNGVEVSRSASMPAGDPAWNTSAASHESSNAAAPQYELVDITATGLAALVAGQNVLAVGVWNDSVASSDLALATLLVIDDESPIIDAAQPGAPRVPLQDIDGDRRDADGNLDGIGRSDLGGDERR